MMAITMVGISSLTECALTLPLRISICRIGLMDFFILPKSCANNRREAVLMSQLHMLLTMDL